MFEMTGIIFCDPQSLWEDNRNETFAARIYQGSIIRTSLQTLLIYQLNSDPLQNHRDSQAVKREDPLFTKYLLLGSQGILIHPRSEKESMSEWVICGTIVLIWNLDLSSWS